MVAKSHHFTNRAPGTTGEGGGKDDAGAKYYHRSGYRPHQTHPGLQNLHRRHHHVKVPRYR
eukprot:1194903-Prorocentrum_minimum.AAC.2